MGSHVAPPAVGDDDMDGLLDWTAPQVLDLGSMQDAAAGLSVIADGVGLEDIGSV